VPFTTFIENLTSPPESEKKKLFIHPVLDRDILGEQLTPESTTKSAVPFEEKV
jgi:hypothetical protein